MIEAKKMMEVGPIIQLPLLVFNFSNNSCASLSCLGSSKHFLSSSLLALNLRRYRYLQLVVFQKEYRNNT
jgi:hypothetical protein